ncbi:hypothetical protein REPUB_Repub08aG0232300 [Reevesia pubescens]
MQRLCTKLRCLALQSTQTLPSLSASRRLLHHSSPPIHFISTNWNFKSLLNNTTASSPPAIYCFSYSPLPVSLVQVRHVSSRERAKRRKPMTPRTSKIKKPKMKFYSSYKSRFRTMSDGNIRRWREGKNHNAHMKGYLGVEGNQLIFHRDLKATFCEASSGAAFLQPSKKSKSESKSWSLSLVNSGDGAEEEEQPVPLNICLPDEMSMTPDSDKLLPRSPRPLQVSPPRNVSSRKSRKIAAHGSYLSPRRSPRLSALVEPESANVGPNAASVETESNYNKLRRSPSSRFTSVSAGAQTGKPLSLSLKGLRRSPRLTSASPETKGCSSETMFKSSKKVSYSKTRSSAKLIDKPLRLSWPKDADKRTVPSKSNDPNFSGEMKRRKSPRFVAAKAVNYGGTESMRKLEVHNSSLSIEKLLRRSMKTGQATKNGSSNVSIRRLGTHEMGFSEEKVLELSPSFMQATENGDSDVSFKEHRREMCNEKQLTVPFSSSTPLSGVDSAEVKSSSISLSNSWDEHPSKKFKISTADSDMRMSDEKFSKSRHKSNHIFIGNPIPDDEAQERWRWRYELKNMKSKTKSVLVDDSDSDDDEDKIVWNVECHYAQAEINGCAINLGDYVYIKGEEAKHHIGKILEFFKTTYGEKYFRVQWFYRAEDTVMKQETAFHDKRRLFYSTVMNDNLIDCIVSKVSVTQISPKLGLKSNSIPKSDFYFDMEYCVEYSTFRTLPTDNSFESYSSSNCCKEIIPATPTAFSANIPSFGTYKAELTLLDLYSGCGGMSTGLCLGAKASYIDLVTKWAIDSDQAAFKSLKLNHPETHVRNEAADDFLQLLKEWEKLCKRYAVDNVERKYASRSTTSQVERNDGNSPKDADIAPGEFEVSSLVDICYGDPCNTGNRGLNFKVRWKGYGASEDTWEPIEGLSNCEESIQEFVRKGFKSKILPLRGDVDVICGGPPCQGISGYNRYRNVDSPLDDERNRQIVVFMDIVEYLKPKFVLMENVVDILRFDKGSLGRYALSRLVHMKYQARLGIIAAGCYGLPQFRLRVFLWGAHPSENLPQFPLPTHDVIIRYWPPPEFERNTVAYDEDQPRELDDALVLRDALSDLPAVANDEAREEMTYGKPPETDFQRYIRSSIYEMTGSLNGATRITNPLYDHRPSPLFEDDYTRVCLIPKRKGANFRDLPGIIVGKDNVVRRDPTQEKQLLPSGRPLVPDYVFTFEQGKSKRPFARLWWDETVPTVVTYPYCHSQAILHPEQDRVLTIRECARLQGFPDYYRFQGTIKERYCQIGNAVALPVARALGYAMGMAFQKLNGNEPLMTLPPKFSLSTNLQLAKSLSQSTN